MNDAIIHDLGYKRYVGSRRAQSTRWQVIMRQQVAFAMKKFWRVKLWIGLSILVTVIIGSILIFSSSSAMGQMQRGGGAVKLIDELVFRWSLIGFTKVSFLLAFTVGCGVIASDLRTGAFNFYFVRPVRPVDYVMGKLIGLFFLQAMVMLAPMLVIAGIRVGMSHDSSEIVDNLAFLPKALLIGGLGSLVYASLALGFSSLFAKPWLNMLSWGIFYIIITSIFDGVAFGTKIPEIGLVDPLYALQCLSFQLHGVAPPSKEMPEIAGTAASIIGLCAMSIGGVAVAYWRVNSAAHRGIGGAS